MDDKEATKTASFAKESVIIASHMDNVNHATVSRNDIRSYIEKEHISNILVPEDGEIMSFEKNKLRQNI